MTFQFEYLADRPQDVPTVIDWWYSVWADRMGSKDEAARQLAASINKQDLPIHVPGHPATGRPSALPH